MLLLATDRTAEIFAWDDGHILKLYRDGCPRDDAQLAAWRHIVAAARMNERIPGEEAQLIAMVRAGLNRKYE